VRIREKGLPPNKERRRTFGKKTTTKKGKRGVNSILIEEGLVILQDLISLKRGSI